jgi:diaminohydroxyphosphoribosylaminopyrimidine deaminase/5-amino-6-(5-phosphoribosylamino)uracil reductase
MTNEQAMKRAIKLALRGSGYVSPNPRVGAVIVKDDNIIAEGWHRQYGADHAEIDAIKNAYGVDLENSILYVNLEPCNHWGNTPPCTEAIIEKKISKVVIGMQDPNPIVSGLGIKALTEAGIEVEVGILENECKWINRFFIKHITTGMPYVVLKAGQSLDGCIATHHGQSKWITSDESRRRTHQLRAELDSVLIGRNTAMNDYPQLTVRDVLGRNPKRVLFDTNLSTPLENNFFKDNERLKTIICCSPESAVSKKATNLQVAGLRILDVSLDANGKMDIPEAMTKLANDYGITSMLVEGGSKIFSSFLKAGMVDEYHIFIAPLLIGNGLSTFGSMVTNRLEQSAQLEIKSILKSGVDLHVLAVNKNL